MSQSVGGQYSQATLTNVLTPIDTAKSNLDTYANKTELTEKEMIEYNLAASKYSTMVSLASGVVKNISDTEKQVANKM
ncbi:MAG: hypothetical protein LBO77_06340 [Desulfovibrio sp.]|jgi:hypothetical protein|nr:hypothetical protein [Desulfovibrio sp.]